MPDRPLHSHQAAPTCTELQLQLCGARPQRVGQLSPVVPQLVVLGRLLSHPPTPPAMASLQPLMKVTVREPTKPSDKIMKALRNVCKHGFYTAPL